MKALLRNGNYVYGNRHELLTY